MAAPPLSSAPSPALGATLAGGASTGVLGLLLLGFGGGAWDLSGPAAVLLGALLAGAGSLVALLAGGRLARQAHGALADSVPRLYPFAAPAVSAAIAVLAVASTASVVSALFAEYDAALNGGDSAGVPDPAVSTGLFLAASVLLWIFAVWIMLLTAQTVRLGRAMELGEGRNVYGRVASEEPVELPRGGPASAPPPAGLRPFLIAATIAMAFPVMAGIQTVEAGADPAAPGAWLVLQVFTPLWAGCLGSAFGMLDAHVRGLERRYVGWRARERSAPERTAAVEEPGRFVP